jgi:hypothetical protein
MDETEPKEPTYSGEKTKITGPESLRSTKEAAESSGAEKTATASKQTETVQEVPAPEIRETRAAGTMEEFAEFLQRTKWVWLGIAGAILGVMTVVTVATRMSERAEEVKEKRQEQAVLDVMPESLIARCGPPAEDVTKDMYPMVLRTMSYQRGENEKIVFEFSRTAEEKSVWVFLSMKDASGTKSFETTEAKIAALPCLDAKR